MLQNIIIYTDGACRGNPGFGGWAAILKHNNEQKIIKGYTQVTTNNKMELTAIIKALQQIKSSKYTIDLYTDSKYAIEGINNWINNWKNNNWRTQAKKPVKNKQLWLELDLLNSRFSINWHWVKGHSGNKYNELVDKLANEIIDDNL